MSFVTNGTSPGGCNIVGALASSITDLSLANSLASSGTTTSIPWNPTLGATVLVLGKTASGSVTCSLKTGSASTIDMSSGTTDVTMGTSGNFNRINTSLASPWVRIKLTDGGSSSSFVGGTFLVFSLVQLTDGENWHSVRSGQMAVASTIRGDGVGTIYNVGPV